MPNLPSEYKKMHTSPGDEAQLVKEIPYCPEQIELMYIRGNWMLIRVIDFDQSAPVGWIRWRSDDGKIFVFPRLDQ